MKQEVRVAGMSCAGCAQTVKERLTRLPLVTKVEISLENKTASIESAANISNQELKDSLTGSPYSIVE